ncbi:MAG: hypothetical protein VB962_00930 [Pseudohongiellaceae bacterium]|jgi:hypothetical protein
MLKRLSLLLIPILTSVSLEAAESDLLFQSTERLEITITAPFGRIDKERDKEIEYAGVLSYVDSAGATINLDVELEVRGNYRLIKSNCRYSQLWVDLKRGQLEGTLFANQNRLKLVVQCGRQNRYADYLVREQQVYTMFSEISDYDFGTRLLNVTYVDSEDEDDVRTHVAFFIEHQNRLADRFGMDKVESNGISRTELNARQGVLVSLFMFLIGNTDYSIIRGPENDACCHNSKLLVNADGEYFPIPYDFDASGFVDASYAPEPRPDFNLRSNRSRLYRGFCVPDDILSAAIKTYQDAKEGLNTIIGDTTYIGVRAVNRTIKFVDSFYEVINNPRKLQREIVRGCR